MNLDKLLRDNIKSMAAYSSARDEYKDVAHDMVFLDANENPFDSGLNRYPDPQQNHLKALITDQKMLASQNLLLGNGSDEVLDLLFRAFCEPHHDSVIILPPTYGMYKVLANLNAVTIQEVNLTPNFELNVEAIISAFQPQTKMLFICSPNNPSGTLANTKAIEELLLAFKGLVVIDEAYIDFTTQKSWSNRLEEFPNLVIIQTLSKAYGLAGIRLGMCFASETIISVLNKIKLPYNINSLTQREAIRVLNQPKVIQHQIDQILSERDRLIKTLKHIKFITKIYPSEANFILIEVDDAQQRYQQLIEHGIVVRDRSNQVSCTNCLRLTIGTEDDNTILINALKTIS